MSGLKVISAPTLTLLFGWTSKVVSWLTDSLISCNVYSFIGMMLSNISKSSFVEEMVSKLDDVFVYFQVFAHPRSYKKSERSRDYSSTEVFYAMIWWRKSSWYSMSL